MATYYALVRGEHIQYDLHSGQLEIYETKEDAENTFEYLVYDDYEVLELEVKKKGEKV